MMGTPTDNDRNARTDKDTGRSDSAGSPSALWSAVLGRLQLNHPGAVRGWFSRLRPRTLAGGVLSLDVENDAQAEYLSLSCRDLLAASAQQATGRLIAFRFVPRTPVGPPIPPTISAPGGSLDDPLMSFEHFAVGPCNRLAAAAASALVSEPDPSFNLLYIHGPAGVGKTHLLRAMHHATSKPGRDRWNLVTAEQFCREWIQAVETGTERRFRSTYRQAAGLLVDDLQRLANRERGQEEFFHTLNTLHDVRARVAVSADDHPSDLAGIEPRLRSRLEAGFVAPLDLPCRETRMAIARALARSRCIELTDSAAEILGSSDRLSPADIAAALTWLDSRSRTAGGRITAGLAQEWVAARPCAEAGAPQSSGP